MNTFLRLVIATLILAPLAAAPTEAGGLSHFGLHVGSNGFGLSVGTDDWAVYGTSWNDPAWQPSFDAAFAGYGEWVSVSGLGRVWRPWVNTGWQPFTHGRWVWTDVGWTWVSYEPWGYYPHHYGNWALVSFGWVWVPGWTYRPAPVTWVGCGSYVGWYPQPPTGWSHAARAYRHGWRNGYDRGYTDGWHDARFATWVSWNQMGASDVAASRIRYQTVVRSAPATHVRSMVAPSRHEVARHGVSIPETRLERRTVRSGEHRITVARPANVQSSIERHGMQSSRKALSPRALEKSSVSRHTGSVGDNGHSRPARSIERSPSRQPLESHRPESGRKYPTDSPTRTDRPHSGSAPAPRVNPSRTPVREPVRQPPMQAPRTAPTSRSPKVQSAPANPRTRPVDTRYREPIPSTRSVSPQSPRAERMKQPPANQPTQKGATHNARSASQPRQRTTATGRSEHSKPQTKTSSRSPRRPPR